MQSFHAAEVRLFHPAGQIPFAGHHLPMALINDAPKPAQDFSNAEIAF